MTTREQLLKAFTNAKMHLRGPDELNSEHKVTYICNAIGRTSVSSATRQKATSIIDKRLNGHETLGQWLRHEKGIDSYQSRAKQQVTRHAWLDSLIKEFS